MRYLKNLNIFLIIVLISLSSLDAIGQILITNVESSSDCYVEQSSNVSYTFEVQIADVAANSVAFSTGATGITFSNPSTPGVLISMQAVTFTSSYGIGTHSFTFEISSGANVGTIDIMAVVSGTDNSVDSHLIPLDFVSATPVSSVTCNTHLNVTLESDCENIIHPDQILEGSNYSCWDEYTVNVIALDGTSLGNVVDYNQAGQTLEVEVTGPNNNVCWGQVTIEDKLGPALVCQDILTTCLASTNPGDPLADDVIVHETHNRSIFNRIPNATAATVSGLCNATIGTAGVTIAMDITHSNPGALSVTLASPSGTIVTVTNILGETFTSFNGQNPNGTWVISITDTDTGVTFGNLTGAFNSSKLTINQTGGEVCFPTPPGVIINQTGATTYDVTQGLDACSASTINYIDNELVPGCSSIYSKVITRTWYAQDASNNISSCTQTIYVYRTGLETIVWPNDYDDLDLPSLPCELYKDVIPGTDITGMPLGDQCDNIEVFDPEDEIIEICDATYKLIRTWKVIDWCTNVTIEHDQIIKVINAAPPVLTCGIIDTISTEPYFCTASYVVPEIDPATIIFNCSAIVDFQISYIYGDGTFNPPSGTLFVDDNVSMDQNGNFVVSGLPLGRSWIKYSFTDACGAMNSCTREVDVFDMIEPNPVCLEQTVVSIDGFGYAFANAESFDNGSIDNCEIDYFEARKLVDICSNDTSFNTDVMFCCSEVNTTIQVELRVVDTAGNSNTCIVEVTVQDNLPPYITHCPDDITIDCNSLDYQDHAITGLPQFVDNCMGVDSDVDYDVDINSCGEGRVLKTWTVTDLQGFTAQCVQTIDLINDHEFGYDDIVWPDDITIQNCTGDDLEPEDLMAPNDKPDLSASDNCDMVSATKLDQEFPFGNGGVKILRQWAVIDWCRYDAATGAGYWTKEQIIKCENVGTGTLTIAGRVANEESLTVNNVHVEISSEIDINPNVFINNNANGTYSFSGLEAFYNYTLEPTKDDEPLNGVTTRDLVKIQKHLLNLQLLDSPYKIIASDVDGSGSVSAVDLIHLRKLILGIYVDFPNNQRPWRFIAEDYVFADDSDPFPYSESIEIVGANQSHFQEDFVGIKVGDVSGDASPLNLNNGTSNRSDFSLDLRTERVISNDEILIEFYADNFEEMVGFQFGLNVPNAVIKEIIPSLEQLNESNFAQHKSVLNVSWHNVNPQSLDTDEPLFTLVLNEDHDIKINDTMVPSEAYNEDLETWNVELREVASGSDMILYQNSPNPFSQSSSIAYNMPEDTKVTLKIFDVNGKVILSSFNNAQKGYNEMTVEAENLPSGILYYQLDSKFGKLTKKMIVIN